MTLAGGGHAKDHRIIHENREADGPSVGVDKTYLASALGLAAARHRFSTCDVNCHQLVEQLQKTHFKNRLPDKGGVLSKYKMLISDEISYLFMDIRGESYRGKERKEFMCQKRQIVNLLFEQGCT